VKAKPTEACRIEEAEHQAERLKQLQANGEDWGGVSGRIAHAAGVLAAARGDLDEAVAEWERAISIAREWSHPWYEADTFYRWGLGLAGAGDAAGALPRFDSALDVYRRIGASAPWLELVLNAKLQAQGIDPANIETSIQEVASLVEDERPDLRPHAAPDGTVTVMFSDIESSTAINERLGDTRWIDLLREHNAIVREHVAAHTVMRSSPRATGSCSPSRARAGRSSARPRSNARSMRAIASSLSSR
jgi:tetratricopeptide (TPR) repeat protein